MAPYRVDDTHRARSHASRVQHIVLHYTAGDTASAMKQLTEGEVSAHYLVTDDDPPIVYRLVDEARAAHHAGVSEWQGRTALNASSIGIEIVNRARDDDGARHFEPYPARQIDAVIALVRDLVRRHGVAPDRVVGHSDIAPQRKHDPGPLFPWHRLAAAGLVRWPDSGEVARARERLGAIVPPLAWWRERLARVGFAVPPRVADDALDEPTRRVIAAFQMKYRPARYDGAPDLETAALLDALAPTAAISR